MAGVSVVDQAVRERAIDPVHSFIVQAPAGSGKTSLLTQRFLALLARVEKPESVVAITFTRKAASEMRQRISEELLRAASGNGPESDQAHALKTYALAQAALQNSERLGWQLLQYPSRLRIQTIDAFCAGLVRHMPYLSRVGGSVQVSEDPEALYDEAIRALLDLLDQETEPGSTEQAESAVEQRLVTALYRILAELDNNQFKLQKLLKSMLAQRDQWLRHINRQHPDDRDFREQVEATLKALAERELRAIHALLGDSVLAELRELANYAAGFSEDPVLCTLSAWTAQLDLRQLDSLFIYRGLATLLLTVKGEWRSARGINKSNGFPVDNAEQRAMKKRFLKLLEQISEDGGEELREAFAMLGVLPDSHLTDEQWQLYTDLAWILVRTVAELTLVFARRNELDYSAVASAAIEALGGDDEVSELALRKDLEIQHLLVDEFQDTSHNQFVLLERLVRNWQPDASKTLFLVGDPMQSIYRFREADVGLFLRAQQRGVGELQLETLSLEVNFRSEAGIVDWVNQSFSRIFPASADELCGAVSFAPSTAQHGYGSDRAVQMHAFVVEDNSETESPADAEAEVLLELIREARDRGHTVGVLARSRANLQAVIEQLRRAGLPYQAEDIETLGEKQVIDDLKILLRALSHPADRIAWLALLRAPWCGLSIKEMDQLLIREGQPANARYQTVWQALQDCRQPDSFSPARWQRFQAVLAVLAQALSFRGRLGLHVWIKNTWLALGGPATLVEAGAAEDAAAFFAVLDLVERQEGELLDNVERELAKRYAAVNSEPGAEQIRLMTIHKSKGLEFDTVILPCLARRPRNTESPLLRWQELGDELGGGLLVAPLDTGRHSRQYSTGLYAYLKTLEQRKSDFELRRLLYVAATRAKKQLHLAASLKSKAETAPSPPGSTLMSLLWAADEALYAGAFATAQAQLPGQPTQPAAGKTAEAVAGKLLRLDDSWCLPAAGPELRLAEKETVSWPESATPTADQQASINKLSQLQATLVTAEYRVEDAIIGSVVHHCLELIHNHWVDDGAANGGWDESRLTRLFDQAALSLGRAGLSKAELPAAMTRVRTYVQTVMASELGAWLVSPQGKQDSHAEYVLLRWEGEGYSSHIVDRTFVDADDMRWVIDYKTGNVAQHIEQYRNQLLRYAGLFSSFENRRQKLVVLSLDDMRLFEVSP